ncbi:MAG: hypothetical protein ACYCT9_06910 [Leptospirillum sp.]|jgi:hypothetical protein
MRRFCWYEIERILILPGMICFIEVKVFRDVQGSPLRWGRFAEMVFSVKTFLNSPEIFLPMVRNGKTLSQGGVRVVIEIKSVRQIFDTLKMN